MRISDWSSDVCSSDLRRARPGLRHQPSPPGDSAAGTARRACARLSAGLRARGHGAGLLLRHPTSPTGRRFPGPDASQCCVTAVVSNYRCGAAPDLASRRMRSEEHTSELQSLMRISYAFFCLKKKIYLYSHTTTH